MKIVHSVNKMRAARQALAEPVGFVATMGALHEGHLSLVHRARDENRSVVVSIFINPIQFNDPKDLAAYPRVLEHDLKILAGQSTHLSPRILVWAPSPQEMYPCGFETFVEIEKSSRPLEGASRPGHFRGVTTVVSKLFNVTQPQSAYFGQKDAQQLAVIKRMVDDLNFPVDIIPCPTIRDNDGLALSSRNQRLSPTQRAAANVLFRALNSARNLHDNGDRRPDNLRQAMSRVIAQEPQAQLEYVSVADPETLKELPQPAQRLLLSMAVRFGGVRLIDNFLFKDGDWECGALSPKSKTACLT